MKSKTKKPTKAVKRSGLSVKVRSASIRELRAIAKTCKPGVIAVSHVFPRAYCVAKPAALCAVFAVPTQDRQPLVHDKPCVVIQNGSAAGVCLGDWRSLAYVSTRTCGEPVVLPNKELSNSDPS